MTDVDRNDAERHYDTLSPDTQLIWRLQAHRDARNSFPELTDATYDAWTPQVDAQQSVHKDILLAFDVMMLTLLGPPATLRPGLLRTAWAILLNAEPSACLGEDDAARLGALARQDTGPIISPEHFADAAMEACIAEEERLSAVLRLPGQTDIVTHPAATSMTYLTHAVRHGMTLEHASPELHAAIRRFLETNDALLNEESQASQDADHLNATFCVVLIIRLLYLPQLLPARIDMSANLAYCAITWRMAHDLWSGPPEWKADLNLLRAHLKALGRAHDSHRQMRSLEHYGPAVPLSQCGTVLDKGMELHEMLLYSAHLDIPDLDPAVLDLPRTAAGRFAERLAYVAQSCATPRTMWGPRMKTLHARVRNVPDPERCRPSMTRLSGEDTQTILDLLRPAARAALLLALSGTPGREVLTVCATGLAQLREATRLGAPIGSMTLEFETTLRALWRSLGCPPCAWLTAIQGPSGGEAEARSRQREALISAALEGRLTPEMPAILLPAPESYAYSAWEHVPEHHDDTEDQPALPFDDLSLTERLVLKALNGKTLVILGGICKPHAKAALIRDLKLKDVDWIESAEYDHGQQATSRLRDPNIVAVIFALRWAAHAHGSIRDVAWSLGIPAVSLPGGYSPRQVLHQLSTQVSGSLVA